MPKIALHHPRQRRPTVTSCCGPGQHVTQPAHVPAPTQPADLQRRGRLAHHHTHLGSPRDPLHQPARSRRTSPSPTRRRPRSMHPITSSTKTRTNPAPAHHHTAHCSGVDARTRRLVHRLHEQHEPHAHEHQEHDEPLPDAPQIRRVDDAAQPTNHAREEREIQHAVDLEPEQHAYTTQPMSSKSSALTRKHAMTQPAAVHHGPEARAHQRCRQRATSPVPRPRCP